MEEDPYEYKMENSILDNKIECHCRIFFRRTMEGWMMRNRFHILRGEMSTFNITGF